MIDLAPNNPYGLSLSSPVIIAPGCAEAGLGRDLDAALIGAVAPRPAMRRAVSGSSRWGTAPAGVVYERLPYASFDTLLRAEARRWRRSQVPVLVSLRGSADDLAEMCARLETIEGVSGVLIAANDPVDVSEVVSAARTRTPLPILAILPQADEIDRLAVDSIAAGADTLVVCDYPSGMATDRSVEGVLIGPTLAPLTLRALDRVRAAVDVPLIALGGVADATIARRCLDSGASAVLIDGALYGDPFAPLRLGHELTR